MNSLIKAVVIMFCVAVASPAFSHGGGLNKQGGHNCSEKSKSKGLCSGYHKHR
ncbi:YHYH domain-containing protein [Psychromonas sp. RZ22]|nr:YHYH domain-containing protein [Psychromonas sp. RZ22]